MYPDSQTVAKSEGSWGVGQCQCCVVGASFSALIRRKEINKIKKAGRGEERLEEKEKASGA